MVGKMAERYFECGPITFCAYLSYTLMRSSGMRLTPLPIAATVLRKQAAA